MNVNVLIPVIVTVIVKPARNITARMVQEQIAEKQGKKKNQNKYGFQHPSFG
jgi:hypothetical protein